MSLRSIFLGSSSSDKIKEERDTCKKKSEQLSKKISELEEIISKYDNNTGSTSYMSGKIQKIQELENELEIQKKRVQETIIIAQKATQIKKDFLSNMRHEVRTPMNSIIAFSDILVQEIKDKTQVEYAKNIFTSGHNLLSLMDNIIELSNLESGIFEIQKKAINTSQFFNSIIGEHEVKSYNKGILLTSDIDETLPLSLVLDDKEVGKILNNLIDNAIKFTSKGTVSVKIVAENHNYASNTVDIMMVVSDTGKGIDINNHKNIFEIFETKDDLNSPKYQGTGIGLSINQKTAKLMNGNISVVSTLLKGSVFTFRLKSLQIILSNAKDETDETSVDFSVIKPEGASVIVIDDIKSSGEIIQEAFSQTKINVMIYSGLREAMPVFQKQKFDLIFIDIGILSVDDNVVSKVIAKLSKAPVVLLRASNISNIEVIKGGVEIVGHLKKPLSRIELFKISLKVLNSIKHSSTSSIDKLQVKDEFLNLDKNNLENFLLKHNNKLSPLFTKAIATNDLNIITTFTKELFSVAKECKINLFMEFSQELLQKIELFDIEGINKMMTEYEVKIKLFKKL